MKLIRHLNDLPNEFRGGAVTVGNFDGVHLGHARLVERLLAEAFAVGGPAIVFTFDPHPARILRPEQTPPSLSWPERKAELLGQLGVDVVIAYPADRAFLKLEAGEFFERIIVGRLEAKVVVEGPNFFFGRDRVGDIESLEGYCSQSGISLAVVQPVLVDGLPVCSSRVRELVAAGRVDEAQRMLTRPYRIRGKVVHGRGRGARLGFPTANLEQIDTLLPAGGIYAGRACVSDECYPAAISVGPNRTFDEDQFKVEAYLLGYEGALYEADIEVDFLARLRDIMRFDSLDTLVDQLGRDVAATRHVVAQHDPQGATR